MTRLQDLHPRLVGLPVGEGRIRRHEHLPGGLGLGPALGEEDALPEVGAPQLAVDAPEVEPRRERQRPEGRLLDRPVPLEHEATRLPHGGAQHDRRERLPRLAGQAQGLGELVDVEVPEQGALDALPQDVPRLRRERGGHGLRQILERAPAEETPEAVEAVVPVVVAGDAEQHAGSAVGRALPQDGVPGPEQAALELVPARQGIRGIAPADEDVSPGQPPCAFPVERVLGEEHPPHGRAQVVIVPGVGDEVDPHLAPEALGQRAAGLRRPQDAAHPVEELRRALRPHPVAQVQLLAGRGHRDQVSQVADERGCAEPADRERRMSSAVEPDHCAPFRPGGPAARTHREAKPRPTAPHHGGSVTCSSARG